MTRFITDTDAQALLRLVSRQHGSLARIARKAGVSPCYLSLMRSGQRQINEAVAKELGLVPVTGFVRDRSTEA